MFLTNKHVVTALIVAPILAIISYFSVDYYVAEKPVKAKQGKSYKLLVKSNCRWQSGKCDLANGNLKISITTNKQKYGNNYLYLQSDTIVNHIKFAIVDNIENNILPESMNLVKNSTNVWQSKQINIAKSNYLQFAIFINKSIFYARVPAIFVNKSDD